MGVEYYVYDTLNKTFYDPGKGAWYKLDVEMIADRALLEEWLLTEEICFDEGYAKNRIAPDLFKAFGNTLPKHLGVVDDCGDDICEMKGRGYRCVGTRYYDKESNDYREAMTSNNRHLNDPGRARLYAGVPQSGKY